MQFFLGTWQNVQQQKLRRKIDNLCEQNVQLQRYTVLMRHFKKHKIAKFLEHFLILTLVVARLDKVQRRKHSQKPRTMVMQHYQDNSEPKNRFTLYLIREKPWTFLSKPNWRLHVTHQTVNVLMGDSPPDENKTKQISSKYGIESYIYIKRIIIVNENPSSKTKHYASREIFRSIFSFECSRFKR